MPTHSRLSCDHPAGVMKVELRRSGGFAAPALSRPVLLDTAELGAEQAEAVSRGVQAARACLHESSARPAAPPVGADLIRYTVTVRDEGGDAQRDAGTPEALTFSDPIPDPALGTLIDLICELGEVQQT